MRGEARLISETTPKGIISAAPHPDCPKPSPPTKAPVLGRPAFSRDLASAMPEAPYAANPPHPARPATAPNGPRDANKGASEAAPNPSCTGVWKPLPPGNAPPGVPCWASLINLSRKAGSSMICLIVSCAWGVDSSSPKRRWSSLRMRSSISGGMIIWLAH